MRKILMCLTLLIIPSAQAMLTKQVRQLGIISKSKPAPKSHSTFIPSKQKNLFVTKFCSTSESTVEQHFQDLNKAIKENNFDAIKKVFANTNILQLEELHSYTTNKQHSINSALINYKNPVLRTAFIAGGISLAGLTAACPIYASGLYLLVSLNGLLAEVLFFPITTVTAIGTCASLLCGIGGGGTAIGCFSAAYKKRQEKIDLKKQAKVLYQLQEIIKEHKLHEQK